MSLVQDTGEAESCLDPISAAFKRGFNQSKNENLLSDYGQNSQHNYGEDCSISYDFSLKQFIVFSSHINENVNIEMFTYWTDVETSRSSS